ncbi:MAG: hypothetical protein LBS60_13670 [Deltaproteobacteria bacterium]|jgi:hypothetical protein|nr:hypothetical protein [Deltaproteobacteria bacterium]
MIKPNTIEDELNKIRLEIYEETKDLSPSEYHEYWRKHGERIAKEFGITIIKSADSPDQEK